MRASRPPKASDVANRIVFRGHTSTEQPRNHFPVHHNLLWTGPG